MYRIDITERAEKQLSGLPQDIANDIADKIRWLAENAAAIRHERLAGQQEYSLHCGQYRIPYLVDHVRQVVSIEDIDKHDATYRKLRRRR